MRSFVACLLLAMSPALFAWGQVGHRVTGAIAEDHLNPEVRTAIARILPNESLAEASTWADDMRSNPTRFWKKTANPWHYVTVPKNKKYAEVGAPGEGDAVTALKQFRATLLDQNASLADKQLALRFTVHLIGDLHQPLHAGNGTDRGGNSVKVEFFRQPSNLHAVWDSGLINQLELSYTELAAFLAPKISAEDKVEWHETNPEIWIAESAQLRDGVYPSDDKLSWDYKYEHMPTVRLRLQQAGIRMAAYLNELFGEIAHSSR